MFVPANLSCSADWKQKNVVTRELDERCTIPQPSSPQLPSTRPSLLTLPPELRNMIYTMSLDGSTPSETHIKVVSDLKLPGLLHTCRQIRAETTKLYFGVNRFEVVITSFDSSLLRRFCHLRDCCKARARISVEVKTSKNFGNLLEWCRWVHRDARARYVGAETKNRPSKSYAIARAALGIARNGRGKSWGKCRQSLLKLRYALSAMEDGWV